MSIPLPRGLRVVKDAITPQLTKKKALRYSGFLAIWFWHPMTRLCVAGGCFAINAYFLAEDPIWHSHVPAVVPLVGRAYELVLLKYSFTSIPFFFIKVLFCILFTLLGLVIGKFLHSLLRDKLRLEMFGYLPPAEQPAEATNNEGSSYYKHSADDLGYSSKGSWMVIMITSVLTLLVGAFIYNGLVFVVFKDSEKREKLTLTDYVGMTFATFMYLANTATFTGNSFTLAFVLDGMLTTLQMQQANLMLWHRCGLLLLARTQLIHFAGTMEAETDVRLLEKRFSKRAVRSMRKMFCITTVNGEEYLHPMESRLLFAHAVPEFNEEKGDSLYKGICSRPEIGMMWSEFLSLLSQSRPTEHQLREGFQFLDTEGRGKVRVSDLWDFLSSCQSGVVAMSPFEIEAVVREIDFDNDGEIDMEDFMIAVDKLLPKLKDKKKGDLTKKPMEMLTEEHTPETPTGTGNSTADSRGVALSLRFRRNYTMFAPRLSLAWKGRLRGSVIAAIILGSLTVSLPIIWLPQIHWHGHTNEAHRVLLASIRALFDMTVVMQDWEFPTFTIPHKPGTVEQPFLSLFGKVNITGKWFNYGIAFLLLILDFKFIINQLIYTPQDYGQTLTPEGYICATDASGCTVSKYVGVPFLQKLVWSFPAVLGLVLFIYLIISYKGSKNARLVQETKYQQTKQQMVEMSSRRRKRRFHKGELLGSQDLEGQD